MARSGIGKAAIGAGLGLLMGAVSGGIAGGLFALVYTPHGGGQIGDWTSIIALMGCPILGAVAGIVAGIAWAFSGRAWWKLGVGLGAAGLVSGILMSVGIR